MRSGAERIRWFLHIVDLEVNPPFAIYKCGIMLILKRRYLIDPLYFCIVRVVHHMALTFPLQIAVLSCILTGMIRTDSKVCAF